MNRTGGHSREKGIVGSELRHQLQRQPQADHRGHRGGDGAGVSGIFREAGVYQPDNPSYFKGT